MDAFLRYALDWPSVVRLMSYPWAWPLSETFHFVGVSLLVGMVGIFDLRLLGVGKGLPIAPLRRLLPWGVLGFALCLITGLGFVLGLQANLIGDNAWDVITRDLWLQLKLLFIGIAGLNLLAFYVTGAAREVDAVGPGEDAPLQAKVIAAVSLVSWVAVVIFGRLIPRGL